MEQCQAKHGFVWKAKKQVVLPDCVCRPGKGDSVRVLSTELTRTSCPEAIGNVFEIVDDWKDAQPYLLYGLGLFLKRTDVELAQANGTDGVPSPCRAPPTGAKGG